MKVSTATVSRVAMAALPANAGYQAYAESFDVVLAEKSCYDVPVSRIPLGRTAEPERVIRAVLLFASPACDFITGQILCIDHGITDRGITATQ